MKTKSILLACLFVSLCMAAFVGAGEKQVVAGAGPSTKIVQMFFDVFSSLESGKGYDFVVPPKSIKHAGGIRAADSNVFGRTGRPLNSKEKQLNKGEIFLARIPVSIAVGEGVGIKTLDLGQLEQIITGQVSNWKAVGGPDAEIQVLGREPTEALFTVLKAHYPFFKSAKFSRVLKKDDQIINYMKTENGKFAIGFGAKPNFENVDKINIVSVDGFKAGVSVGLVYNQSNKSHPLVKAVSEFAVSSEWAEAITGAGFFPPSS